MQTYNWAKHWLGPASIVIAIALVTLLIAAKPAPAKTEQEMHAIKVSTVTATAGTSQASILAHGSITPRWRSTLSAEVNGRILSVSDHFLMGSHFKKGDVLAIVDPNNYLAAVAQAKAKLASTQHALFEEKERVKRAELDWQKSGFNGQPSALILRQPQLDSAVAGVAAAKANLQQSRENLKKTKITAPYDGVVISRSINPGELLSTGTRVGEIYSTQHMEVALALSRAQLDQISDEINRPVTLIDASNTQQWHGKIKRITRVIDSNNRWRHAIVEIDDQGGNALPGEFVSARIAGKAIDHVFQLPESSLSHDQQIWHVTNNTLQRFDANVIHRENATLFVKAPKNLDNIKAVISPQRSFLPGTPVEHENIHRQGS